MTAVSNTVTQGILAKLLALENIQVHVGDYKTAFFDVKNRILGLPSWNFENKHVSDLLVGHEVGHAIYTPADGLDRFKVEHPHIPFAILNVVEDIRIERLIQSRYPGLVKSFNEGYANFLERDLFRIKGRNVNGLGFVNRLNIKAKLRHLIDVEFSDAEEVIFAKCRAAETFDEVLALVVEIYEMIKAKRKPKPKKLPPRPSSDSAPVQSDDDDGEDDGDLGEDEEDERVEVIQPNPELPPVPADNAPAEDDDDSDDEVDGSDDEAADTEGFGGSDEDEPADDEPDADDEPADTDDEPADDSADSNAKDAADDEDDSEKESGGSTGGTGCEDTTDEDDSEPVDEAEEFDSFTLDSLQENLASLQVKYGNKRTVVKPSPEHFKKVVTPWRKVMAGRLARLTYADRFLKYPGLKDDWIAFKKVTRKNIQNLITDFERRKSAYQYSRSQQSDSGDIDLNRLHAYRFDDQIFSTVTRMADAKSHGMMFFIDYSSSMSDDINNVLEHTLALVMFCDAVKIPFQVFGFTNINHKDDSFSKSAIPSNQLDISTTNIFELLSSEMDSKTFEVACRHLRAQIFLATSPRYLGADCEIMSGTPLIQTLIVAHELVAAFRRKHHIQKMNVIVLSDGEGSALSLGNDSEIVEQHANDTTGKSYFAVNVGGSEVLLRGYDSDYNYSVLINNLKKTLNCKAIGFFITRNKNDIKKSVIASVRNSLAHGATATAGVGWEKSVKIADTMLKSLRKVKSVCVPDGFNFDGYFVINTKDAYIKPDYGFNPDFTKMKSKSEFTGADTHRMAKEFTKYTSDQKSSRIILAKFAELIA
jgi:hypothetical protein